MFPFQPTTMLAPMEGVTHPAMRALLAERGGIGVVSTEFVRISRAPLSQPSLVREVVKLPGVPLSVQVMGNEPEKMAEGARIVAAAGADVVDINLGCPAPRVVKKGVGSAMLKDPAILDAVLRQMRAATSGLLSAKIRAGFDNASDLVRNARIIEAAGVDFLVVHPRRRCDFFDGVADWRAIKVLKETIAIPVVGNGDCWYASDALRMMAETGCDAVMIGRPAIRNPWIFEQIDDLVAGRRPRRPSGAEVVAFVRGVVDRLATAFPGSGTGSVGKLKELLGYVGRAVPDDRQFHRAVLRLATVEEILDFCAARLAAIPPEGLDLGACGELGLERSGRV